jgi:hypothetical protein
MPKLAGALIHGAVTLLAVGMATAGAAVLVAAIAVSRLQLAEGAEWLFHVRTAIVGCALSLLIAAVTAMRLLPRRRDLTTPSESTTEGPATTAMVILLITAVAATAQIPILLAWGEETQSGLRQITGGVKDSMGLWMLPVGIAAGTLGLAALIAFIFTIMPAACYAVQPRFALRTLQVLFVLQAGLVLASAMAATSVHELLTKGLAAMSADARPGELTAFTDGVARQGQYVMTLLWRFACMLAGSVAALVTWTAAGRLHPKL